MEKRRVVITGMGTVNPLGHNIAESWQAVRDGVCGIAPITQYATAEQLDGCYFCAKAFFILYSIYNSKSLINFPLM